MRLKTMILSMKVLLLGAAVTTATATATAQGTTRTTGTERTVHAGDHVTTITVDGTPTTITDDVKSVTAAPGAKVKVTAAPPQQGKRARLVITKAASSSSGQTQSPVVTNIAVSGESTEGNYLKGFSYQMTAAVTTSDNSVQSVTWKVLDEHLPNYDPAFSCTRASIDESGKLTCNSDGMITVFALPKDGSTVVGSKQIVIESDEILATHVYGKGGATVVKGGETLQMEMYFEFRYFTEYSATWRVADLDSNENPIVGECTHASISTSGLLSPISDGNVRVYAKSNYDPRVEASCDILVKDATGQPGTGDNGGGQGTGEVTPGTNPGGQGAGEVTPGTTHDLKIIVPNNVTNIQANVTIKLSATDNGYPASVNWSVDIDAIVQAIASINDNGEFTGHMPGTVIVTATLIGHDDVKATKEFQIVQ